MIVRIANREDTDQTTLEDQTASVSALFVLAFMAGNKCSKF